MTVEELYEELKSLRKTVAYLAERIDIIEHPWKAKADAAAIEGSSTMCEEAKEKWSKAYRPMFEVVYEEGISRANSSDMTVFILGMKKTSPDPENPLMEKLDSFTYRGWNWGDGLKVPEEKVASFCAALGNVQRVKLMKALTFSPKTAADLAQETGISSGQFYHHIQELLDAGFVENTERNIYTSTELGYRALVVALTLVSQS